MTTETKPELITEIPFVTTWDEVRALKDVPVYIADANSITGGDSPLRYLVESATLKVVICETSCLHYAKRIAHLIAEHGL